MLGPLEVVGDGGAALAIGTGRQRALLGLLILRANELLESDRLVEELWGESPPPTAHKMLHNQVSGLRQVLGRNGRLETHGSAYRLNVAPGERDVDRFEELVARGRTQAQTDPERAAEDLRQALGLWRGRPLADLAFESFAQTEIVRLEERRWAAFEARVDAELALGRHADLVAELEAAVAEQPLREHLHGQLMLALYRCGRQAEALEAYRRARTTLVEEIGVEPHAELRALQEAILAQDAALDAPPGVADLPAGLDGGSPVLAGRDGELAELVALVADACHGRGGLAFVSGPQGIGKTRLAQELAREALRRRMAVLYTGAADALAAVSEATGRERATLLIVDDADDANVEVLERAAASSARRRLLVLVLQRGTEPPALLDGQLPRRLVLGPLGARRWPRSLPCMCPPGPSRFRSTPSQRRAEASRWPCIEWRGIGRGRGRRRRSGRAPAAPATSAASCGRPRRSCLAIWSRFKRSRSSRGATAARPARPRWRRSVRSPGWLRSTRTTPSTSSGASGWSPSWSPGSWARRCSP